MHLRRVKRKEMDPTLASTQAREHGKGVITRERRLRSGWELVLLLWLMGFPEEEGRIHLDC